MAGSSARNPAEKMMAYRMASRSTRRGIYTSPARREFGCGTLRAITSALSSFRNNRQISPGEMLTTARCTSRDHFGVSLDHQGPGICAGFAPLILSDKDKNELHPFDEECFAILIDLPDLRLTSIHVLSIVFTNDSRRYHSSRKVHHSHRSSRRRHRSPSHCCD